MQFKKGNRAAKGGSRHGAGRKLSPSKALKKLEQEKRIMAAEEAFEFLVKLMRNPKVPWGIRLAAAQDIQDRVFGKPKQSVDHSGALTLEQILSKSWDEPEKV